MCWMLFRYQGGETDGAQKTDFLSLLLHPLSVFQKNLALGAHASQLQKQFSPAAKESGCLDLPLWGLKWQKTLHKPSGPAEWTNNWGHQVLNVLALSLTSSDSVQMGWKVIQDFCLFFPTGFCWGSSVFFPSPFCSFLLFLWAMAPMAFLLLLYPSLLVENSDNSVRMNGFGNNNNTTTTAQQQHNYYNSRTMKLLQHNNNYNSTTTQLQQHNNTTTTGQLQQHNKTTTAQHNYNSITTTAIQLQHHNTLTTPQLQWHKYNGTTTLAEGFLAPSTVLPVVNVLHFLILTVIHTWNMHSAYTHYIHEETESWV